MPQLSEIQQIENKISELQGLARVQSLGNSEYKSESFPVYKIVFGTTLPKAPTLLLVGGVHGLERIGSQVVLAMLTHLMELAVWDKGTQDLLQEIRVVFIPVVNPWGIYRKTRSNPRGVDLMRNAPVDGEGEIPFLLGGHRYTSNLPWYRGALGAGLEVENQYVEKAFLEEAGQSTCVISCDFHSGFGFQDQLWFPWAKSTQPWSELSLAHSFKTLIDRCLPQHIYRYEPQAQNYTTHGDLWDYLYLEFRKRNQNPYLPLCLEMGSWTWVKKNPWQLFSADGPFNPLIGHRHSRTLRRHLNFFELMLRAVRNPQAWAHLNQEQRFKHEKNAMELWYES